MDPAKFLGDTALEMLKAGVQIRLSPDAVVTGDDGAECSGWFDPETPELVSSVGAEHWLEIYAHEYCHFTQWLDGRLDPDERDIIWEWLEGDDFNYEEVAQSTRASQLLEADNERRTVALIEKYDLPIDIKLYRQKANAYILFYDVVLRTRRWANGTNQAYSVPQIYERMPSDRILEDDELVAPEWFYEAVKNRCMRSEPKASLWKRLRRKLTSVYDPQV